MSANWSRRQRAAEHVSANDTSGARRDSCTLLGGRPPVTPDGLQRAGAWVVGAITPFNFSLNLVAHKLGPAITAGCPVICKPADRTPLTAVVRAELLQEAGLPAGWLAILTGDGAGTRATLARDPGIAALSSPGRSPWLGNSPVMHLMREYCSSSGRWLPRSQETMRTSRPSSTASWRTPLLRRPELRVGSTASRPRGRRRRTARSWPMGCS
jgi:hypothetical protein